MDHHQDQDSERYGMYAGAFEEEGSINVEKVQNFCLFSDRNKLQHKACWHHLLVHIG